MTEIDLLHRRRGRGSFVSGEGTALVEELQIASILAAPHFDHQGLPRFGGGGRVGLWDQGEETRHFRHLPCGTDACLQQLRLDRSGSQIVFYQPNES